MRIGRCCRSDQEKQRSQWGDNDGDHDHYFDQNNDNRSDIGGHFHHNGDISDDHLFSMAMRKTHNDFEFDYADYVDDEADAD